MEVVIIKTMLDTSSIYLPRIAIGEVDLPIQFSPVFSSGDFTRKAEVVAILPSLASVLLRRIGY